MKKKTQKSVARALAGFSLVELMVALGVFLVVGGAAVALVRRHVSLFSMQQNQVGLNFSMRNAMTQLQVDVVNAGSGFNTTNVAIPAFGLSVFPPAAGSLCNPAPQTYGAGCFDQLNIVQIDQSAPPSHPIQIGTNCDSTTSSNTFVSPADPSVSLATEAAAFHSGDMILVLNSNDGVTIDGMATVVLTKDGSVNGNGKVQLQHNPQGATDNLVPTNQLGGDYCGPSAWVLKLSPPTVYFVDVTTDPTNPKLTRRVGIVPGVNESVIAEQVVGFRVGSSVWNGTIDNTYNFDPTSYKSSEIRSVMISLIGRSGQNGPDVPPNAFDGGKYKVEASSVVINPRNLSMKDSN